MIRELCRLFNAKRPAIECALRHGQITVDGYTMRVEHDKRWTREQLKGRRVAFNFLTGPPRLARLYEETVVQW